MNLRLPVRSVARAVALLTVSGLAVAGLAAPARAATGPSVTITSPAAGTTVSGTVTVAVTGSTDPASGDEPVNVDLFVDGTWLDNLGCGTARPVAETCDVSVDWDTTGLSGSHTLLAEMNTVGGDSVLSSAVTVVVTSPGPSAVITAPTAGTTVQGIVTVAVTGSTDPSQSDEPQNIDLFVDGTWLDNLGCGIVRPVTSVCDVTYDWDTTGLTGSHTLLALVNTTGLKTALSRSVTVTVTSPAPTVVFTSPDAGSVVGGATTVTITGSTDPSQSDEPQNIDLFVDGTWLDNLSCGIVRPVTSVCDVTYDWDTTGLAGAHTLAATVNTVHGRSTTTFRTVRVWSGTSTSVSVGATVKPGTAVTARGRVTTTADGAGVPGATVRVTLIPAVGTKRTVTLTTSSTGAWSLPFTARTNTKVTAATVASDWYSASSRSATKLVLAPLTTAFAASTARVGTTVGGTASAKYLPAGTTIAMQYRDTTGWHTFHTFSAPGSSFRFGVKFGSKGTYDIRLVAAANRVYARTAGPRMRVVIR